MTCQRLPRSVELLRTSRQIAILVLLLSFPVGAAVGQQDAAAEKDDLQSRLHTLDQRMEEARVKNKIPGLAIAIVQNDEVIFAKGYGLRDIENDQPVETDTLFAVGSTTKAFTGAMVAMLVDSGKMNWDDPVTKFMPDFQPDMESGDDEILIRDLLAHRTGFTRMGILWAGGKLSREEVVAIGARAKPFADFRERFLYNNVMFMAAGLCAARAADSDWDTLIAERIFEPLEMNSSSTSIRVAQQDERLSLGYQWDEDREIFAPLPMRNLDAIAPSGSINSNVIDMAQWVRFQLGRGEYGGQRLLSEENHRETWTKQMEIAGGVDYGFGWMLRQWNGKQVVEHGGNIDGFAAQVTLLPEENTGYVLLANVTATPLQAASMDLVFESLFGEVEGSDQGLEGINTDELTGNYIANFGPFNNATFEVLMKDGSLAVDVPGQMTYELKSPDDEGKWSFAVTDSIAVSFNRNDEDKVISMTLHQGGMTPEFIREDVTLDPESPLAVTAPLVGKYRDEEAAVEVEVSVRNGRMVVDTGGNGTFTLLPPDENGKWALRANPGMLQLRFNKDDDGSVKSMTRMQGGNEVEMPRVGETGTVAIPEAEELIQRMRAPYAALADLDFEGIRMMGTADFIHQGAEGTIEVIFAKEIRHRSRQDFGELAIIEQAYDGEQGYSDSSIGLYEVLAGRRLNMTRLNHPLWFLQEWQELYPEVAVTGQSAIDGKDTFELSFSGGDLPDRKLHVSAETGLILRDESAVIMGAVGEIPVTTTFQDYRDVGGIPMPFKSVTGNPFNGDMLVEYESAELLDKLTDDMFVVLPETKK